MPFWLTLLGCPDAGSTPLRRSATRRCRAPASPYSEGPAHDGPAGPRTWRPPRRVALLETLFGVERAQAARGWDVSFEPPDAPRGGKASPMISGERELPMWVWGNPGHTVRSSATMIFNALKRSLSTLFALLWGRQRRALRVATPWILRGLSPWWPSSRAQRPRPPPRRRRDPRMHDDRRRAGDEHRTKCGPGRGVPRDGSRHDGRPPVWLCSAGDPLCRTGSDGRCDGRCHRGGVECMTRVPIGATTENGPGEAYGPLYKSRYQLIHQGLCAEEDSPPLGGDPRGDGCLSRSSHTAGHPKRQRAGRFSGELCRSTSGRSKAEGTGELIVSDEGIRGDSNIEKLSADRPS